MGANNSTHRVSFESDEHENIMVVKGVWVSDIHIGKRVDRWCTYVIGRLMSQLNLKSKKLLKAEQTRMSTFIYLFTHKKV